MAKYFRFPWAVAGDKTAIPDPTQSDGSVSYQQGYGLDYARDPATDANARDIEREMYNQALFDITATLQQHYQQAYPPFITAAENGGTAYAYSQYARVRYDPGTGTRVYESLVANNTALPTVTTNWQLVDLTGLDARYIIGALGTAEGNSPQIGTPGTTTAGNRSAVITRAGSNANGSYIVFSNNLTLQSFSLTILPNNVVNLPIRFSDLNYQILITANSSTTTPVSTSWNAKTVSSFLFRASIASLVNFDWYAIGY